MAWNIKLHLTKVFMLILNAKYLEKTYPSSYQWKMDYH